MAKIRIHELAKELEINSKDLVEKAKNLGLSVTSHMSSLDEEESELIKALILDENKKVKSTSLKQNSKKGEGDIINMDKEKEIVGEKEIIEEEKTILEIEESIVVKDLADELDANPAQIITKLIELGVMVNQTQSIDSEIAKLVAEDYNVEIVVNDNILKNLKEENKNLIEDEFNLDYEDKEEDLVSRPPVVTVMGHVDHGKTSLLDAIKETSVTTSEAGGITQHIGAYSVEINGKKISFLDTPGHEAFTSMRARGAQVTDIAILVVAADDGIMPQTIEAISHAKAANVPIIVAINKMDKHTANIERVKQELVENNLMPEDWGGETITVPVSAKNRDGIEELLEMILLVAEMEELKANPNRNVVGTIVEAELDKGKGPIATVLVQKGTLRVGDMVASGTSSGRIRAMFDDKGKSVKEAGPSIPVVILGLSDVPNAGELIYSFDDEKTSRAFAERKRIYSRELDLNADPKVSLDDLFERIKDGEIKELNIIVKGDVRGSIEALKQSLGKLDTDEVRVNTIHGGVGGITESDIMLASASNAIVVGFNVRPNLSAIESAKKEKVDIRTYRVIYEAIEDIQSAIKGMHTPKMVEEVLGRAEIRDTFRLPTGNSIAGIYVLNGKIPRNAQVRLLRDDVVIFEGGVSSLKRFKDDAREVAAGYEAGLGLENYNDVKEGDLIEAFMLKEVKE